MMEMLQESASNLMSRFAFFFLFVGCIALAKTWLGVDELFDDEWFSKDKKTKGKKK